MRRVKVSRLIKNIHTPLSTQHKFVRPPSAHIRRACVTGRDGDSPWVRAGSVPNILFLVAQMRETLSCVSDP